MAARAGRMRLARRDMLMAVMLMETYTR
jgi:hypothetical protein